MPALTGEMAPKLLPLCRWTHLSVGVGGIYPSAQGNDCGQAKLQEKQEKRTPRQPRDQTL